MNGCDKLHQLKHLLSFVEVKLASHKGLKEWSSSLIYKQVRKTTRLLQQYYWRKMYNIQLKSQSKASSFQQRHEDPV